MGVSLKRYKKKLCCKLHFVSSSFWITCHKIEYSSKLHGILKADTYAWKHQTSITWAQFIIKIICIKCNLVILKVLPFYTLASVVLTLLESFLQALFLYGCEPCCCNMLNFFYESNIKTFEPRLQPCKEQRSCTENMMVGGWLDFGSSLETGNTRKDTSRQNPHWASSASKQNSRHK
jgi:hypothetical protein